MRINEVLAGKAGHEVVTVSPDATVRELVGMLAEHNIGALVVSGDGSSVDGIVSERDVVRRLHDEAAVLDSPVSSIMSTEVATCSGTDTVNELMALMTERRFRHVPVVKDDKLVGIVSIGDVVKSRMSELEFERDQLDSYVQSAQT
jgi:CBS domain-containing protein